MFPPAPQPSTGPRKALLLATLLTLDFKGSVVGAGIEDLHSLTAGALLPLAIDIPLVSPAGAQALLVEARHRC